MIRQIESEYGGDLCLDYRNHWLALLEEIVYHLARDGFFDSQERAFFQQYVTTFRLDPNDVTQAYNRAAERAYAEILEVEVGPDGLSDEQSELLERIARRLRISDDSQGASFKQAASKAIHTKIANILADDLVSPGEWMSLTRLCDNLNVSLHLSPELEQMLRLATDRWAILDGHPPTIDIPDLKLPTGERAFWSGLGEWYEYRKVRIRGGTSEDRLHLITQGQLVITSTRILIVSDIDENKSAAWKSILRVRPQNECCFELEKARGKSPLIKLVQADHGPATLGVTIAQRAFDLSR